MRISEERYQRDLRRLHLAWRLILLKARTPTIGEWTGLSVHRIRRLRNHYAPQAVQGAALKGVTPFRVEFFLKSPALRCEAPILAGFLRHYDVLPLQFDAAAETLAGLSRGERFVTAFDQFHAVCPDTEVTFEHAVMLLTELVDGTEIGLGNCEKCFALIVRDRLSSRRPVCPYCLHDKSGGLEKRCPPVPAASSACDGEQLEYQQRSLF